MISKKTVLVLGAGASAPYGFPTGPSLLETAVNVLGNRGDALCGALIELGHSGDSLLDFAVALKKSRQPSVDAFLERRPEYLKLGMATLAGLLMAREDPGNLEPKEADWYSHLFRQLDDPRNHAVKEMLTVVTFNYDRSLEAFLDSAIEFSYGRDRATARKESLMPEIIHVHGSLGSLRELPYLHRHTPDAEAIEKCSGRLKVLSEASDDSPEFELARVRIQQAEILCFLGFGFHPTNVRRLGPEKILKNCRFMATAKGMGPEDARRLRAHFPELSHSTVDHIDALEFVRSYPVFD